MDVLEHIKRRREVLDEVFSVLRPGGQLVLQCPNLYCNVVSTNYRHSVKNILIKTGRAWKGWWRYLLHRPIPEPEELRAGLDWLFADDDAVVLTSPYWFLDYFKRRSDWELRHYTSWSFAHEKKMGKTDPCDRPFHPFPAFPGRKDGVSCPEAIRLTNLRQREPFRATATIPSAGKQYHRKSGWQGPGADKLQLDARFFLEPAQARPSATRQRAPPKRPAGVVPQSGLCSRTGPASMRRK
jgi:SAM-dependent methyltransferase